jgi:hypothetical protein
MGQGPHQVLHSFRGRCVTADSSRVPPAPPLHAIPDPVHDYIHCGQESMAAGTRHH